MTINLYYVHGISNIDTPYFATSTSSASRTAQEDYFDSKLVKSIETAFYPPHYKNEIKFDNEDLDFNTNVNYLSLEFNDRRYYYFIDDIEYVSETVIRVYCTMDVIQTYMFDLEITNGIIERQFINRWVRDEQYYRINRDYIRENVSGGEFYYYNRVIYNADTSKWLLCMQRGVNYHTSNITQRTHFDNTPALKDYSTTYMNYFTPLGSWDTYGSTGNMLYKDISTAADTRKLEAEYLPSGATKFSLDAMNDFGFYSQEGNTIGAFICPFNCLDTLEFGASSIIYVDWTKLAIVDVPYWLDGSNSHFSKFITPSPNGVAVGSNFVANLTQHLYIKSNRVNYTFEFTRNDDIAVAFDTKYLPVLLDENYIHYWFGSTISFTSLPLFKINRSSLQNWYTFNPSDGTRLYWCTRTADEADIFNTCVIDSNVINVDIKNNNWKDYIATNRGRWLAAIANTAVDIYTKGSSAMVRSAFAESDINRIMFDPKNIDRRTNNGKLKKRAQRELNSAMRDKELADVSTNALVVGAIANNIGGQLMQDVNHLYKPTTPKQMASLSSAVGNEAYIMSYEERVVDFNQVAQYYHRNGYLTNTYINYTDTLFEDVQNRYYFNVLKMSLPEVHLKNVIEDETTIMLLKQRLTEGLRLWNVLNSDNIGDFQYDNVEYDFITQGGN